MELLTKQVSLSLTRGWAGVDKAGLGFTQHMPYGLGDGHDVALPFCWAGPAPTRLGKLVTAVPGEQGRGPSPHAAAHWRTHVRFLWKLC